jgi:hypothetical protein
MRFARPIKQVENLGLLVADNETRGKCAAVVLLRGQTAPRISDYSRE